jgi:ketosteroid isomerase-like protein
MTRIGIAHRVLVRMAIAFAVATASGGARGAAADSTAPDSKAAGVPPDSIALAAPAVSALTVDTLVAAERSFSKLSVEKGMKEAFLTYLADDAILFHPVPVNGSRLWRRRANPPGTLIWEPDFAEVSGAGDLGVTSGPWEYRPPTGRDSPTGYGHFITVWKRAKSGAWRVAVDIGVDHAKPEHGLGDVRLTPGPAHEKPPAAKPDFGGLGYGFGLMTGSGVGLGFATGPGYIPRGERLMARAINGMMTAERAIAFAARTKGIARAYAEHADPTLCVHRDGEFPACGSTEALAVVAQRTGRLELLPLGDGMSSSHDLGYSYGLLTRRAAGGARPDTSAYLHVWRRDAAGRWKLAVDVENEFPKGK